MKNRKQNWVVRVLMFVCMTLFLTTAFACKSESAEPSGGPHEHTWGEWVVEEEPTCYQSGVEVRTCQDNPMHQERRYMDIVGHDYIEEVTDPTCTEMGYITYTCRFCYDGYTNDLDATGHEEETIPGVAPSLGKTGLTDGVKCSVCDTVLKEQETLPALYSLTVSVNADAFGSATVLEETVAGGSSAGATATPKTGYAFLGWFDGDLLVSTDAQYTFDMPEKNLSLTARFTANQATTLNVWDGTIATAFAGGEGTENNPYLISTGAELAYLASAINKENRELYNKYYQLTNNIDLNGLEWDPIGCYYKGSNWSSDGCAFVGTFDGNGYTVSNFKITSPKNSYYRYFGLFGYMRGTVKNLGVENFIVDVSNSNPLYSGGLIGYSYGGTVSNCYATGNVTASSTSSYAYAGGLIGDSDTGTVSNCYATGNVTASSTSSSSVYAGGLIGDSNSTVSNCYATGNVTAGGNGYKYVGCIFWGNNSSYSECYYYEGQVITVSDSSCSKNTDGTACTLEQLNAPSFYTETLGWDTQVWDCSVLNFENGQTPKLSKTVLSDAFGLVGEKYYQIFIESGANGKVNSSECIVRYGNEVELIATPDAGYRLKGWYIDGEQVSTDETFRYLPTKACTVTAQFDIVSYTVTVTLGSGVTVTGNVGSYHYGDKVTLTAAVQDGYTFVGWYDGDTLLSENLVYEFTINTYDYALTAKSVGNTYKIEYAEKVKGKLIFNSMGGSPVESMTSDTGEYPVPTLEGYLFTGWYTDMELTEKYAFEGELTETKTLYAGWVKHNGNGTLSVGETLKDIPCNSSIQYYAFTPLVSGNVTIYTTSSVDTYGYLYNANKSQLKYNDNSGSGNNFKITYDVTAGEVYYISAYTNTNYGTYSLVLEGETLKNTLTIKYIESVDVQYGESYKLIYMEKDGLSFVGYFTEENGQGVQLTNAKGESFKSYATLDNVKVYACYVPCEYTITLDYNDGVTEDGTLKVKFGHGYTLPEATREQHIFDGWYYNDVKIENGAWEIIDGNITLTAKWTQIPVTDITLVNGDTLDIDNGKMELVVAFTPNNAYYSTIEYVIVEGAEATGATIENNYLFATVPGELSLRINILGEESNVLFTKDIIIYVYTTHIASIEIVNTDTVLNADESLTMQLEAYPTTGYPRGEYVYQLANNTCGASIKDGVLTATQPGSVRVRVKVDESDWSSYVWFYVTQPISTAEEFYNIRNDLSGHYVLTSDIDLSQYTQWQPIGYAENSDVGLTYAKAFKGYVDGNGHKITGLTIDVAATDYLTVGLFGALDNSAQILNLHIQDYYIYGETCDSIVYLGGLAGIVNGSVSGGSVSGRLDVRGSEYIGGAIGLLFGSFTDSKVDTDVYVGGAVQRAISVGGAVGYYANGKFVNCEITAKIGIYEGYGYYVGGVCGQTDGALVNVTLTRADIEAEATEGTSYAGLYVGKTAYALLSDINVNGSLKVTSYGTLYLGGVVGYALNVDNSTYSGEIIIGDVKNLYYGNVVGYADGDVTNVTYERGDVTVEVTGNLYYGGIAGYVDGNVETAEYKVNSETLTAGGNLYYGGIAGAVDGNVQDAKSNANSQTLKAKGKVYSGGIAGQATELVDVSSSVDTVQVEGGETYYGGIVGYASETLISVCSEGKQVTITATGDVYYGGILGYGVKTIDKATVDVAKASVGGVNVYYGSVAGKSDTLTDCTIVKATAAVITKASDLYFGNAVGYASGTISDISLKIENAAVEASGSVYYGGIAGYVGGQISKVSFEGDIDVTASNVSVGGVVGKTISSVENSFYRGNITLNVKQAIEVGGIAGSAYRGVTNSKAYSIMNLSQKAGSFYAGGIAGLAQDGVVNTYFFGYITASSDGYINSTNNVYQMYVGGIVGYVSANIENSISNAIINVTNKYFKALYVGGVAGYTTGAVSTSKADGNITCTNEYTTYAGGLVGRSMKVLNSYSVGDVSVNVTKGYVLYIGGIAGEQNDRITECYYSFGDLFGQSAGTVYSGGISGFAKAKIDNSYSSYSYIVTDMSKSGSEAYLGGITGYNNVELYNVYSMNFIDGKADGENKTLYIGGLAGYNNKLIKASYVLSATDEYIRPEMTVADIETTALNSATVYAGGLVGYNLSNGEILNSYTENTLLTRNSYTGGLVGKNEGSVKYSISRSPIQATLGEKIGAFVGLAENYSTFVDCYYSTSIVSEGAAVGTGNANGITGKTTQELRGTSIYANYNKAIWTIVNGKEPKLSFEETIWTESEYGYNQLINVRNSEDQHDYPIPKGYCKITFDVGEGEYPVDSIYVYTGEGIFLVTKAQRIGYIFKGWYFDNETFEQSASEGVVTFSAPCTLYAKWEAIPYTLTVETDGKGETNIKEQTYIYQQEITLTTDDVPLDYVFVGWFENGELLSSDKEYTFSALARDQIITAKYLTYYDLLVEVNSAAFGKAESTVTNKKGIETETYTVTATANEGYAFFGWFDGNILVSTDAEYTFEMPSNALTLTACFTSETALLENAWDGSIATAFEDGDGTESNPYLITTGAQLAYLANGINSSNNNSLYNKHYKLTNNIDLNGLEWDPIGCYYKGSNWTSDGCTFVGTFDGNGYTVSNFKITSPKQYYYRYFGLFGYVRGTVKNLGVEDFTIDVSSSYVTYVGGLVGLNDGKIVDCYAKGDVSATGDNVYAGGLLGYNENTVTNCYSTSNVTACAGFYDSGVCAGGLIGYNDYGYVYNSFATGNVYTQSNSDAGTGGLVGYSYYSNAFTKCYRYERQIITENDTNVSSNSYGTVCTLEQLNSRSFYTETLGWNAETWECATLNYKNGKTPTLCDGNKCDGNKEYYQLLVETTKGGTTNRCEAIVPMYGNVLLIATPNTGYCFVGWYIDGETLLSAEEKFYYYPTDSHLITAKFEIVDYTVNAYATYDEITVSGSGIYHYKDSVRVTAETVEGYEFGGWYIDGQKISSSLSCMFSMYAKDVNAEAKYYKYFSLETQSSVESFGETETQVSSAYETQSVSVKATANEGYVFFGWFDGDLLVSTDAEYTFEMPSRDYVLTARFTAKTEQRNVYIWDGSIATAFAGGDGTESNPYLITTGAQLAYLANEINSNDNNSLYNKHYKLTNDINLNGLEWDPIGCNCSSSYSGSSYYRMFQGTFDGNGHTINNFKITTPKQYYYRYFGLFGLVQYGTIKDLGVEDFTIDVSSEYNVYIGGLAGYSASDITYCYALGEVTAQINSGDSTFIGGLVGYLNDYTLQYCYANVDLQVSNSTYVSTGGLVGCNHGEIHNSYATGNIYVSNKSSYAYAGGLVGYNNTLIDTSYATGDTTITSAYNGYAGGLVGYNHTTINTSYATGDVSVNSSNLAYAGGFLGYNNRNNVTYAYKYEGQTVMIKGRKDESNFYGTSCTLEDLNSSSFYTETLGWDGEVWDLSNLNFANGKTPLLSYGTREADYGYVGEVGERYYRVFVETYFTHGSTGGVNVSEYLVKDGCGIYLVAMADAGYELVGWYLDGELISEDDVYLFVPDSSVTVLAEFDLIRYTLQVSLEDGITCSEYQKRYYENEEITLTATLEDGYVFDGWYVDGNLVCTELTYTFAMPTYTYRVQAMSTPIDYYLTVSENLPDGGALNLSERVYHVHDEITLTYDLTAGYRFLGWFVGDKKVCEDLQYVFEASASDLAVEVRTELIEYTLSVSSQLGGTVDTNGGIYTVVDEITLTATEDKTYDFMGWYTQDGRVFSYEKLIAFYMPAKDLALTARFEVAYVEVNALAGFNGSASGTDRKLKDSEITVKATPDEGYRFTGWYLNGELVSTDATYTAVYNVSGTYTLYASFDTQEIEVTYDPNNGGTAWTEKIEDEYLFPYAYREGYVFEGWYLDKGTWLQPLTADVKLNSTAYAKWRAMDAYLQYFDDLTLPYTVELYSRTELTNENIATYFVIYDVDGDALALEVTPSETLGYYTLTANFKAGGVYDAVIQDNEVFCINGMRSFGLSFARDEIERVDYQSEVLLFTTADVVEKKADGTGVILRSETPIAVDDLVWCVDDEGGCVGYVAAAIALDGGQYDITFSNREVEPEKLLSAINVNQGDVEFELNDSDVEGDVDEAMEVFSQVAMEASSVPMLMSELSTLSTKDRSYSFEKPQVKPEFKLEGQKVIVSVTITINGARKDAKGEKLDEFAIRIRLTLANEVKASCDIDYNVLAAKLNKFETTLSNTTTVTFELDLVYGSKGTENNFDALEMLLKDYKTTLAESKEPPFDTDSMYEDTFEKFQVRKEIPIGTTPLRIAITITPFVRYKLVGQIDVNTSFSVTNACTLSYVKGKFNIYTSSETTQSVELYALAYANVELGVRAGLDLYIVALQKLFNAGVHFEAGPYVTASGALIYDDSKMDFTGFMEWGYFYDWGADVTVFGKKFEHDPDKVVKPLGSIGQTYLYLSFEEEQDEYVVEQYSLDLYREIDLSLYAFDLKELNTKDGVVSERDNYVYELEENDYLYINVAGQLKVKQIPNLPIDIDLTVSIGGIAIKTVVLTINVNEFDVVCKSTSYGTLKADKAFAMIGEKVAFKFVPSSSSVILENWIVNGEKIPAVSNSVTLKMVHGGLKVGVEVLTLKNVTYIYSAADLEKIRYNMSGTYVQMADIDFQGGLFTPIGSWYNSFTGKYFGNGYTIRNVQYRWVYNDEARDKVFRGMFAVTSGATLHNIRMENVSMGGGVCYVSGSRTYYSYTAGLAAYSRNTNFVGCEIDNLTLEHSATAGKSIFATEGTRFITRHGGICGFSEGAGLIDTCSVTGVQFSTYIKTSNGWTTDGGEFNIVGGIIGESYQNITIRNCYVQGAIKAENSWTGISKIYIGGIAGLLSYLDGYSAKVENCLTDVTTNYVNDSNKKNVSAIANFGENTTSSLLGQYAENLYYNESTYTDSVTSLWDNEAIGYNTEFIYEQSFIFDVLGFDPMMWELQDGKLALK